MGGSGERGQEETPVVVVVVVVVVVLQTSAASLEYGLLDGSRESCEHGGRGGAREEVQVQESARLQMNTDRVVDWKMPVLEGCVLQVCGAVSRVCALFPLFNTVVRASAQGLKSNQA